MIYIHTFSVGIDGNRKEHRKIYDTFDEAEAQQVVLGGAIQAFESVEEIALRAQIAASEISEKFDDIATRQQHLEAPLMWHKSDLINKTCKIIRGEFDKITGLWK